MPTTNFRNFYHDVIHINYVRAMNDELQNECVGMTYGRKCVTNLYSAFIQVTQFLVPLG